MMFNTMKTFKGQNKIWHYKKMGQMKMNLYVNCDKTSNKIDNISVNKDTSSTSCIKCLAISKCNGI
jgi:hypothetical protein